ncbi:MAG: hypothetical protein WCL53_05385 [Chloroflexota bacterium]
MHRTRVFTMGLFFAAVLAIGASPTVSADNDKQKDKGKNAPEVPLAAGLPIVASLSGGAYYLVARTRTAMSRRKPQTRAEHDTE